MGKIPKSIGTETRLSVAPFKRLVALYGLPFISTPSKTATLSVGAANPIELLMRTLSLFCHKLVDGLYFDVEKSSQKGRIKDA